MIRSNGVFRHKFGAKPTVKDNIRFASKLEASYYQKLKLAQRSGKLLFFLRQVPFDLPGGLTYRADFLEFWEDGTVKVTDCKGFETKEYIMKKKLLEENYPIELNVVKRA